MSAAPSPRRILMTTDTAGEAFDYAVALSAALSRRGVEVLVATMGAPLTAKKMRALSDIERLKIFESRFKSEWMDDPWGDLDAAGEWLLEIENATRPDLVHSNGYAMGALPWRAPCVVVGHSCLHARWSAGPEEAPSARLHEYDRRVRRGLRHATMVVATSAAALRSLEDRYGSFERCRVIYNGGCRHDFELRCKEPFVFAIGNPADEASNLRLVDQIAADLPWPVLVAGNSDDAYIDRERARLKHAQFLCPQDENDVDRMLARASIYVHPARYEPFGLTVLQAALAGCALVLGDTPMLREIWQGAAVFVPSDDAARLSRELELLTSDGRRRASLGERARRTARQFTSTRMASEYLSAYRQALGASNARRDEENYVCA